MDLQKQQFPASLLMKSHDKKHAHIRSATARKDLTPSTCRIAGTVPNAQAGECSYLLFKR